MDIYHWQSPHGNFGDDLNLWIWDYLLPEWRKTEGNSTLMGIGTVIDENLLPANRRLLVLGAGTGYGVQPNVKEPLRWDVRCVRGPLTATALGLDAGLAAIDPAAILPDMPEFQGLRPGQECIFVPHWESAVHGQWERACALAKIHFVTPCDDAHRVVRRIAQAQLVIAESMHAAIIADAFRVPWIAVSSSSQINDFKWNDWASSLNLTYQPHRLPPSNPAEAGAKGQTYFGLRWPRPTPDSQTDGMQTSAEAEPASVDLATQRQGLGGRTKAQIKALLKTPLMSYAFSVPSALALKKIKHAKPQLSDASVLAQRKARFYEAVESVRRDYLA